MDTRCHKIELKYHPVTQATGCSKLPLATFDGIVDTVSVMTTFEPITMSTMRLMKSEAIRIAKSVKIGEDRAFDLMTSYDLTNIVHNVILRRSNSELSLVQDWTKDYHIMRLHNALTRLGGGGLQRVKYGLIERLFDNLQQRLSLIGLRDGVSFNIPVGISVF